MVVFDVGIFFIITFYLLYIGKKRHRIGPKWHIFIYY